MSDKKKFFKLRGATSIIVILVIAFIGLLGYTIYELINIDPTVTPTQQMDGEVSVDNVPEIKTEDDLETASELLERLDFEADEEYEQLENELSDL